MRKTVGIIGFGRFGELIAESLRPHFWVKCFDEVDRRDVAELIGVEFSRSLEDVLCADVVILSVPISHLESVLNSISPLLKAGTLVLDVCSVKEKSVELMERILPDTVDIIGTHPLFGPDTTRYAESERKDVDLRGRKICLCPLRASDERLNCVSHFLKGLGISVIIRTPEEHDREMADVQCLTHFISMGLMRMNLAKHDLTTPNYEALMSIVERLSRDTPELLFDIQKTNPHSLNRRRAFLKALNDVEEDLDRGD